MSLAEGEEADPEVSRAMAEYALMIDTAMRVQDIEALPADEAAILLAVAERTMAERAAEVDRIKAQAASARRP